MKKIRIILEFEIDESLYPTETEDDLYWICADCFGREDPLENGKLLKMEFENIE